MVFKKNEKLIFNEGAMDFTDHLAVTNKRIFIQRSNMLFGDGLDWAIVDEISFDEIVEARGEDMYFHEKGSEVRLVAILILKMKNKQDKRYYFGGFWNYVNGTMSVNIGESSFAPLKKLRDRYVHEINNQIKKQR